MLDSILSAPAPPSASSPPHSSSMPGCGCVRSAICWCSGVVRAAPARCACTAAQQWYAASNACAQEGRTHYQRVAYTRLFCACVRACESFKERKQCLGTHGIANATQHHATQLHATQHHTPIPLGRAQSSRGTPCWLGHVEQILACLSSLSALTIINIYLFFQYVRTYEQQCCECLQQQLHHMYTFGLR